MKIDASTGYGHGIFDDGRCLFDIDVSGYENGGRYHVQPFSELNGKVRHWYLLWEIYACEMFWITTYCIWYKHGSEECSSIKTSLVLLCSCKQEKSSIAIAPFSPCVHIIQFARIFPCICTTTVYDRFSLRKVIHGNCRRWHFPHNPNTYAVPSQSMRIQSAD